MTQSIQIQSIKRKTNRGDICQHLQDRQCQTFFPDAQFANVVNYAFSAYLFWPLRLWNGGDVNLLIKFMSGGILCESRQVGLHVKAQKEWYISVVFLKTLHFQMKRPSVPSQRWGHWPTIIHKDFIIYKRLCTWSGTVYIWAASYWGGSRNLLKIIDKISKSLAVKNPCFI